MDGKVFSLDDIKAMVRPIAENVLRQSTSLALTRGGRPMRKATLTFWCSAAQALSALGFLPLRKSCTSSFKRKLMPLK